MGAIADGIVAYAKPLLDGTDGSIEQANKALKMAQLCFNLALVPKEKREESICDTQESLGLDDDEFADFRRDILDPMIRRHEEMFPLMHGKNVARVFRGNSWLDSGPRKSSPAPKKPLVTDRYAPCPCNSGKKYKFCCGMKR